MRRKAAGLILLALTGPVSRAEVSTPFIDQVKKEMSEKKGTPEPTDANPDPYIQSVKNKLKAEPEEGSFIDKVKKEDPTYFGKKDDTGYSDKIKAEIGPGDSKSAIQAVAEGHSELHAKKEGEAHAAFGIQVTDLINPDFTASNGAQPFSTIYPGFTPDVSVTYNRRILRFWSGELAFNASFGGTYDHGSGLFQFPLKNYNLSGNPDFPIQSATGFQFFTIPISVGLDYRMTGLKYVQPYISVAPTLIPYFETRNDGLATHYGDSRSVTSSVGLWIQLNWLSKAADWSMYNDYGIQSFYLTVLYQNVTTLSGGVDFSFNGGTVGLAFEY